MAYDDDTGNEDAASAIGGIGGAIPGLNIITPGITQLLSGGAQRAKTAKALALAQGIDVPEFSSQGYDQIGYAGNFDPALYDTPEAAAYKTIDEDPETRAIQMEALRKLAGQANGAADAQNAAGRFSALNDAAQLANQREGAIRQEMERKGQGGTGVNALMRAQAAQMGANRAQAGTLDAYSKAALQKLAAMQGAIGAAGQVRGQDFNTANANADIINKFNMFNTQARNAASQGNVNMRNEAGLRNINTRQGLMGQNTGIRNASLDRRDTNAQRTFNNQGSRVDRINGILTGQARDAVQNGQDANAAGAQGYKNFQSLMSMAGGGMGGAGGGMGGGMMGGGGGGGMFSGDMGDMDVMFR